MLTALRVAPFTSAIAFTVLGGCAALVGVDDVELTSDEGASSSAGVAGAGAGASGGASASSATAGGATGGAASTGGAGPAGGFGGSGGAAGGGPPSGSGGQGEAGSGAATTGTMGTAGGGATGTGGTGVAGSGGASATSSGGGASGGGASTTGSGGDDTSGSGGAASSTTSGSGGAGATAGTSGAGASGGGTTTSTSGNGGASNTGTTSGSGGASNTSTTSGSGGASSTSTTSGSGGASSTSTTSGSGGAGATGGTSATSTGTGGDGGAGGAGGSGQTSTSGSGGSDGGAGAGGGILGYCAGGGWTAADSGAVGSPCGVDVSAGYLSDTKAFGGTGEDRAQGISVGADGALAVVGYSNAGFDLGSGVSFTTSSRAGFLLAYTPNGQPDFVKVFNSINSDEALAVVIGPDGSIFVSGSFANQLDLGPPASAMTSVGFNDAFVARYSSGGVLTWAVSFGSVQTDRANALALSSDASTLWVAGTHGAAFSFQGSDVPWVGGTDMFLFALDASDGKKNSVAGFGSANTDHARGLAMSHDCHPILIGTGNGDLSLGNGPVTVSGGGYQCFAAKMNPTTRIAEWSSTWGGSCETFDVAVDSRGRTVVAGQYKGALNGFPPPSLPVDVSLNNMFVVQLSEAGAPLWARGFGGSGNDEGRGVGVDPDDNVFLFGDSMSATMTAGNVTLTNGGSRDQVLVKLDDAGTVLWARNVGGPNAQGSEALAVDDRGHAYAVGNMFTSANLVCSTPSDAGNGDVTLLKHAP